MLQDGGVVTAVADNNLIKDVTTQTFVKDVIEESKRQPVLVDFWAEWCGPCKQLGPILEKVVSAAKGKVKLVKMDIDKHPQIPQQLGIQSIPAVFAFVNGQPVDGFMGALPEAQVVAFIERVTKDRIGGEEQDMLKAADAALAANDAAGAAELYAQVLAQDNANVPALAGLARCHVLDRRARAGKADARDGAGGQAQRCRGGGRARRARARRAGASGGSARRAGAEGRGQPARSSGAASISRSRSPVRAAARRRSTT